MCLKIGQQDTHDAAYKDYDRSARIRCVGPGNMEQPTPFTCQTEDFNSVHKTPKSHLQLLAPVMTLFTQNSVMAGGKGKNRAYFGQV